MAKRGRAAAALILCAMTTCSVARGEDAIRLQFRPEIGKKQTMRVDSRLSTTCPTPSGQDRMEHIKTFTVELEPTAVAGDGTVTVRIGIQGLFVDSHNNSMSFFQYDSSQNRRDDTMSRAPYRAAIGESFIVTASARGKLTSSRRISSSQPWVRIA